MNADMDDYLGDDRADGGDPTLPHGSDRGTVAEPDRGPEVIAGSGPGRWKRRLRRLGMVAVVLIVTGTVSGLAGAYLIDAHLSGNVKRISGAFQGYSSSERPAARPVHVRAQTILAVGLDIHAAGQTTGLAADDPQASKGGERSDAIMLIRFDPQAHMVAVVSIPRDSWTLVPGHGMMKINAAYALGGPVLLVRTVERLTGIRIDHFMALDFAGFRSIVDALNGVDVDVFAATTDLGGHHFRQGVNHLGGTLALAYVRQRYGLPQGDLDRVRRQQSFLRAVFTRIAALDPTDDPVQAYRLLDAMTKAITVDDTYTDADLRALALEAMRLRSGEVWFLTARVAGLGREDGQSVVYLDQAHNTALWQALRDDTTARYVAAHRADLLAPTTR